MENCVDIITSGIEKDCATLNAAIGVDKDLILINYADVDITGTLAAANIEADDTNNNIKGLTEIKLKVGTVQYIFEGTDFSVVPNPTSEVREDGTSWYNHSIQFMSYSKTADARKTMESLGQSKVIAIAKDRSTGLYELFGIQHGLTLGSLERAYVGSQNSNFYSITIGTPEVGQMKESSMGELAVLIVTAVS